MTALGQHEQAIAKRGRGRPPGAPNLKTRLKRELFGPDQTARSIPLTPTQVLAANMAFFQGKSEEFVSAIHDAMKAGAKLEDIQDLLREACKLKVLANDAAQILAPYVHPKVESVPQKTEDMQPFVIRVPDMLPSPEAWSHAVSRPKDIEGRAEDGIGS